MHHFKAKVPPLRSWPSATRLSAPHIDSPKWNSSLQPWHIVINVCHSFRHIQPMWFVVYHAGETQFRVYGCRWPTSNGVQHSLESVSGDLGRSCEYSITVVKARRNVRMHECWNQVAVEWTSDTTKLEQTEKDLGQVPWPGARLGASQDSGLTR